MTTLDARPTARPDRAAVLAGVLADLEAESAALLEVLEDLEPAQWSVPTPSAGWDVRDQVTHLAFFDDATLLSTQDVKAFEVVRDGLLALGDGFPDDVAARYRDRSGADCLAWFRSSRAQLLAAYRAADPVVRLPWFGPPMGLVSSATARLMETWAHGQDVLDTLGLALPPTPRLRHVADLGVRTLAFSFALNGLPAPDAPVHVALDAPDGSTWTWGPEDALDRVRGSALDFCLLVTQRRRRAATGLVVEGPVAEAWCDIAQAFAGGVGRSVVEARAPQPAGA